MTYNKAVFFFGLLKAVAHGLLEKKHKKQHDDEGVSQLEKQALSEKELLVQRQQERKKNLDMMVYSFTYPKNQEILDEYWYRIGHPDEEDTRPQLSVGVASGRMTDNEYLAHMNKDVFPVIPGNTFSEFFDAWTPTKYGLFDFIPTEDVHLVWDQSLPDADKGDPQQERFLLTRPRDQILIGPKGKKIENAANSARLGLIDGRIGRGEHHLKDAITGALNYILSFPPFTTFQINDILFANFGVGKTDPDDYLDWLRLSKIKNEGEEKLPDFGGYNMDSFTQKETKKGKEDSFTQRNQNNEGQTKDDKTLFVMNSTPDGVPKDRNAKDEIAFSHDLNEEAKIQLRKLEDFFDLQCHASRWTKGKEGINMKIKRFNKELGKVVTETVKRKSKSLKQYYNLIFMGLDESQYDEDEVYPGYISHQKTWKPENKGRIWQELIAYELCYVDTGGAVKYVSSLLNDMDTIPRFLYQIYKRSLYYLIYYANVGLAQWHYVTQDWLRANKIIERGSLTKNRLYYDEEGLPTSAGQSAEIDVDAQAAHKWDDKYGEIPGFILGINEWDSNTGHASHYGPNDSGNANRSKQSWSDLSYIWSLINPFTVFAWWCTLPWVPWCLSGIYFCLLSTTVFNTCSSEGVCTKPMRQLCRTYAAQADNKAEFEYSLYASGKLSKGFNPMTRIYGVYLTFTQCFCRLSTAVEYFYKWSEWSERICGNLYSCLMINPCTFCFVCQDMIIRAVVLVTAALAQRICVPIGQRTGKCWWGFTHITHNSTRGFGKPVSGASILAKKAGEFFFYYPCTCFNIPCFLVSASNENFWVPTRNFFNDLVKACGCISFGNIVNSFVFCSPNAELSDSSGVSSGTSDVIKNPVPLELRFPSLVKFLKSTCGCELQRGNKSDVENARVRWELNQRSKDQNNQTCRAKYCHAWKFPFLSSCFEPVPTKVTPPEKETHDFGLSQDATLRRKESVAFLELPGSSPGVSSAKRGAAAVGYKTALLGGGALMLGGGALLSGAMLIVGSMLGEVVRVANRNVEAVRLVDRKGEAYATYGANIAGTSRNLRRSAVYNNGIVDLPEISFLQIYKKVGKSQLVKDGQDVQSAVFVAEPTQAGGEAKAQEATKPEVEISQPEVEKANDSRDNKKPEQKPKEKLKAKAKSKKKHRESRPDRVENTLSREEIAAQVNQLKLKHDAELEKDGYANSFNNYFLSSYFKNSGANNSIMNITRDAQKNLKVLLGVGYDVLTYAIPFTKSDHEDAKRKIGLDRIFTIGSLTDKVAAAMGIDTSDINNVLNGHAGQNNAESGLGGEGPDGFSSDSALKQGLEENRARNMRAFNDLKRHLDNLDDRLLGPTKAIHAVQEAQGATLKGIGQSIITGQQDVAQLQMQLQTSEALRQIEAAKVSHQWMQSFSKLFRTLAAVARNFLPEDDKKALDKILTLDSSGEIFANNSPGEGQLTSKDLSDLKTMVNNYLEGKIDCPLDQISPVFMVTINVLMKIALTLCMYTFIGNLCLGKCHECLHCCLLWSRLPNSYLQIGFLILPGLVIHAMIRIFGFKSPFAFLYLMIFLQLLLWAIDFFKLSYYVGLCTCGAIQKAKGGSYLQMPTLSLVWVDQRRVNPFGILYTECLTDGLDANPYRYNSSMGLHGHGCDLCGILKALMQLVSYCFCWPELKINSYLHCNEGCDNTVCKYPICKSWLGDKGCSRGCIGDCCFFLQFYEWSMWCVLWIVQLFAMPCFCEADGPWCQICQRTWPNALRCKRVPVLSPWVEHDTNCCWHDCCEQYLKLMLFQSLLYNNRSRVAGTNENDWGIGVNAEQKTLFAKAKDFINRAPHVDGMGADGFAQDSCTKAYAVHFRSPYENLRDSCFFLFDLIQPKYATAGDWCCLWTVGGNDDPASPFTRYYEYAERHTTDSCCCSCCYNSCFGLGDLCIACSSAIEEFFLEGINDCVSEISCGCVQLWKRPASEANQGYAMPNRVWMTWEYLDNTRDEQSYTTETNPIIHYYSRKNLLDVNNLFSGGKTKGGFCAVMNRYQRSLTLGSLYYTPAYITLLTELWGIISPVIVQVNASVSAIKGQINMYYGICAAMYSGDVTQASSIADNAGSLISSVLEG